MHQATNAMVLVGLVESRWSRLLGGSHPGSPPLLAGGPGKGAASPSTVEGRATGRCGGTKHVCLSRWSKVECSFEIRHKSSSFFRFSPIIGASVAQNLLRARCQALRM